MENPHVARICSGQCGGDGAATYCLAGRRSSPLPTGLLLGLSLYGLLAAALKVVHDHAPPPGYAWPAGALVGLGLLLASLLRNRVMREGDYEPWSAFPPTHPILERFETLVAASSLEICPALRWVDSSDWNAFAVGRSRANATIVLTAGLVELLQPEELDTVLAQQIAHIESEDLRTVGLADSVADSIDDLTRAKGRFLWGPRTIFAETRPFLAVSLIGIVLISVLSSSGDRSDGTALFSGAVSIGLLYALWVTAKRSWLGVFQLFLFISFFGPMSLVEAALAPPTAILLSRLISRARIHEADVRAVELTCDRMVLAGALRKLGAVERSPASPWLDRRRFSLFVSSLPRENGYWAWLARLYATHPSIASRIKTIESLDQTAESASSSRS
jgi:Zn-dependent protease with chaperone function